MLIEYHIKVTGGNADVTSTKESGQVAKVDKTNRLRADEEKVKFTSNDKDTVIRYRSSSPFDDPEVGPQTILKVGKGSTRPFVVKKPGLEHHFDCGFINPATNKFTTWGQTEGADTPADDGSGPGPG